jgi:hypothetical protein
MSRRKIIGQPLPRPGALKLGDVAAIPLTDGRFGYGRQFRDAALGVLKITSQQVLPLESVMGQTVAFFVSYCEPIDHPDWIYVGKWKFDDEDTAWGPAQYIRDVISPDVYRIYHRGKMRAATKEETDGLARHVLLSPSHVRERIETFFRDDLLNGETST